MSVVIKFDGDKEVQKKLATLTEKVKNLAPLHKLWSMAVFRWVAKNFESEGALTGKKWKSLAPITLLLRRKGSSRILQDTGALRRSFFNFADSDTAEVGAPKLASNLKYAKTHQFGRGNIPKRPMLPETFDLIQAEIEKITISYIESEK